MVADLYPLEHRKASTAIVPAYNKRGTKLSSVTSPRPRGRYRTELRFNPGPGTSEPVLLNPYFLWPHIEGGAKVQQLIAVFSGLGTDLSSDFPPAGGSKCWENNRAGVEGALKGWGGRLGNSEH